jgi:septation ring formation regulator EzrA
MEIILIILVMVVCFVSGWTAREKAAERRIDRLLETVQHDIKEKIDEELENLIPIKIEYDNSTFFVYNNDDHTFMAQGSTRKELENNLEKRYPGKRFAARPENLKEVGFNK